MGLFAFLSKFHRGRFCPAPSFALPWRVSAAGSISRTKFLQHSTEWFFPPLLMAFLPSSRRGFATGFFGAPTGAFCRISSEPSSDTASGPGLQGTLPQISFCCVCNIWGWCATSAAAAWLCCASWRFSWLYLNASCSHCCWHPYLRNLMGVFIQCRVGVVFFSGWCLLGWRTLSIIL